MYLSLIDTVSKIVNNYGIDILSDSKFWHILSDSYSFRNDYALRDIYKRCLSTGYVSKLIAIKGNSKKTKAEIANIIDSENKLNPGKEKEYSAVLYSIAIAIGSCNKKDYSDFINRNNPSSKTAPNPIPPINPKNPKSGTITFGVVFSTIIGLILLFSGTMLYGAYLFDGWWMFFVVLLIGLEQLAFCSFCLKKSFNPDSNWSDAIKRTAVSCQIPIISGFFINSLVPLFLCNDSIRAGIYRHFAGDIKPYNAGTDGSEYIELGNNIIEAPGFFSIVLAIIVAFSFLSCCLSLYSEKFSFSQPRFNLSKRAVIIVSSICIFGYLIFFTEPSEHDNQSESYNEIYDKYNQIQKQNHELIELRKNLTPELSFKGIKLEIPFETAYECVASLSDFESNKYCYYSLQPTYNAEFANMFMSRNLAADNDSTCLTGRLIAGQTTLADSTVCLRILERNNKVYSIIVLPKESENSNSPKGLFYNYSDLVLLYREKYGEPERIYPDFQSSEYNNTFDDAVKEFAWTFGNGTIRLSANYIIYSTKEYESDIKRINHIIEQRKKAEELEQEYKRYQIDSAKTAERLADSLRRATKHKTAIDDI